MSARREQFLMVENQRLETVFYGPPPTEAGTMVFLHEGLGCCSTWRDFPAQLAEETGCGALVYSRCGYGRSAAVTLPRPLNYMQEEGLRSLPALLDAAGVRTAVLIGHSDGGSIALVHAGSARAEPRIGGLILEAAHVFCEDISVVSIERARQEYLHGDLRERLRRHHGDNVDGAFWGWNRAWLDPDFRNWNIESFLPKIRVPTLAIQGEADPYGTLRQIEAIEEKCGGPVRRLILPGCGHAPHREREAETLAAMSAFIRTLDLATG